MSALGGPARKFLPLPFSQGLRPQWSTDGTRLAAVVRRDDGNPEIQILTVSTREIDRVQIQTRAAAAYDLSWSQDGRFFAYVDAVDRSAEVTQLWVTRVDDATQVAITDGTSQDWSPSWSPDGRRLFLISNRQGSMDLWQQRIDTDGVPDSEPERITTGVGMRSAAFSPDGSKLAYTLGRGRVANVWRVPVLFDRAATWSDAEQLTFDQAFIEFLDVSPDGEQLVLSSDRGGNQDLWALSSDGGEMRQLTDDPMPDWRPWWSYDGNEIAFYSYRSGNREIWIMAADGSGPQQVTHFEGPDLHPSWSPDETHLAFASVRSGDFQIFSVSRGGGEPRLLVENLDSNLPAFSGWRMDSPPSVHAGRSSDLAGACRRWRPRTTDPRNQSRPTSVVTGR